MPVSVSTITSCVWHKFFLQCDKMNVRWTLCIKNPHTFKRPLPYLHVPLMMFRAFVPLISEFLWISQILPPCILILKTSILSDVRYDCKYMGRIMGNLENCHEGSWRTWKKRQVCTIYPPWNSHSTWEWKVGILVPLWDGLYSGAC